jgi:hypothetical protein
MYEIAHCYSYDSKHARSQLLIAHMEIDDDIDPRVAALSYRELQAKCTELGLPARGKGDVLRKQLNDFLNNPRETLKRLARDSAKKNNGDIDWKNSAAREILLEDLEPPRGWLYGVDDMAAEDAYKHYKETYQDIFDHVPFKQFERRYKEAIQNAAKRRMRSAQEEEWLKHDRKLYPRQSHNHRGEPVFDMDEAAKQQLKKDIENKLHRKMEPIALWEKRAVYQKYKPEKFRQRIYQYEKRVKFFNYLDHKRKRRRNEYNEVMTPKEVTFERVPKKAVKTAASRVRVGKGPYKRSRSSETKRAKRSKGSSVEDML